MLLALIIRHLKGRGRREDTSWYLPRNFCFVLLCPPVLCIIGKQKLNIFKNKDCNKKSPNQDLHYRITFKTWIEKKKIKVSIKRKNIAGVSQRGNSVLIFSSLTPITIEVKGREGLEAQEQLQDKKKYQRWNWGERRMLYSQKHFRVWKRIKEIDPKLKHFI